jgi:hypothetical protein
MDACQRAIYLKSLSAEEQTFLLPLVRLARKYNRNDSPGTPLEKELLGYAAAFADWLEEKGRVFEAAVFRPPVGLTQIYFLAELGTGIGMRD